MSPDISERFFEEAIECALLQFGPDACAGDAVSIRETEAPYGETPPGGYRKRRPEEYDRTLCLLLQGATAWGRPARLPKKGSVTTTCPPHWMTKVACPTAVTEGRCSGSRS